MGHRPATNTNIKAPEKSFFKSGSVRTATDGLTLMGTVGGKTCNLTIDTGSNISIVRPDVLDNPGEMMQASSNCLRTVTGDTAPIQGHGELEVGVGSLLMPHGMWIADITDECILGLDFLEKHDCQVCLKEGVLVIGGQEIPLAMSVRGNTMSCSRVIAKESCIVAAQSEAIIPGQLVDNSRHVRWAIVGGNIPQQPKGLLIGRCLVDLEKPVLPVRVLNPARHTYRVAKGTELASCEPVVNVYTQQDRGFIGGTLPTHLVDLLQRSTKYLDQMQLRQAECLLIEFADVFSKGVDDLGQTSMVHHQIQTGTATPIRQPPRRLPLVLREEANKTIESMQKQGIIEPSSSPWASPVVLVRKKDGSTRFCVDYRKLNNVTKKDSYPLPRIDETLEALAGSKWFSSLDLRSGYWQVKLDPADKEKTAFSTGLGLWQFTVMPFGLCNAPATFERLMEQVLRGLPLDVCLLYLDDILVPGKTFDSHLNNLRQVLQRLRNANLKLSPEKTNLFQKEVTYLGHVVGERGVSTDHSKICAIESWPLPNNRKELKKFLGLCSYYRRFVPNFAEVAHPLHELAQDAGANFEWTDEAKKTFQNLKQLLTSTPVLGYPDSRGEFVIDTDASNYGLGAVLSQTQDGVERVIAYYSRALSQAERNYCATRKELLAVVQAVKHFHPYLYGKKFKIRSDHASLQWLLNFRHPEGQLARWIEVLQMYDFTIEHRPGKKHANADALSRRPCQQLCNYCIQQDEKELERQKKAQDDGEQRSSSDMDVFQIALVREREKGTGDAAMGNSTTVEENAITTGGGKNEEETAETLLRLEEFKIAQQQDPDIAPIVKCFESDNIQPQWSEIASQSPATKAYWAQWNSLRLKDGILYRLWVSPTEDHRMQLVVPRKYREDILRLLHDSPTSGHFSVNKTLCRVRHRFYWVGCGRDVKLYCSRCNVCASRKGPAKKQRAPMKMYNVGAPMERVAIDVLGPLPLTEKGNKYLLIAMDYFTKWPEAFAIPNQEATTVAKVLVEEFFCRFGVPLEIHSDQGRNFESTVFQEVCKLLRVNKTRTTPLHPQSDGMVERMNRTLEAQLAIFINENQTDWDEYVPLLLMAYRSAVHDTTKCTPAELMLGRNVRLPVDLLFGHPEEEREPSPLEYIAHLQERIDKVHHYARANIQIASERMKEYYDTKADCVTFSRGDWVWLYNPTRKKGISPKLSRPWKGPYLVTEKVNDVIYRIQLSSRSKPKVVHRNRLWAYTGTQMKAWIETEPKNTESSISSRQQPPQEEIRQERIVHVQEPQQVSESRADTKMNDIATTNELRRSNRRRKQPDRYGSSMGRNSPETCEQEEGV